MITDYCCVCGVKSDLEVHHVQPLVDGGSDDDTNKITVCSHHHGLMHSVARRGVSSLTKAGIKKAREAGVKLGRPKGQAEHLKLDRHRKAIESYLARKLSVRAISILIDESPTTVNDYIRRHKLRDGSGVFKGEFL